MDLGFSSDSLRHDGASPARSGDFAHVPDWHELLPRLHAGWSARREWQAGATATPPHTGNFDPVSAQVLAEFDYALRTVNSTALGNGKSGGRIDLSLAGESHTGRRG